MLSIDTNQSSNMNQSTDNSSAQFYKTLTFTGIFHLVSYFITLSIIYMVLILDTEKSSLYHVLKKQINDKIKEFEADPGFSTICEKFVEHSALINEFSQPLNYKSTMKNSKLIMILILIIVILILGTFIAYKYLNIGQLTHLKIYLLDLLLIVIFIGIVEYLFFKLIASNYIASS